MAKSKFNIQAIAMRTVGLAGGGVVAKLVTNKFLASMNPLLSGAIVVAGGAVIGEMMGKKQPLFAALGDGMIAAGATTLVGKFIPGIGAEDSMTGVMSDDMSTVGYAPYEAVSGDDVFSDGVGNALAENSNVVGVVDDMSGVDDSTDY